MDSDLSNLESLLSNTRSVESALSESVKKLRDLHSALVAVESTSTLLSANTEGAVLQDLFE
jgi:hypothetical protein